MDALAERERDKYERMAAKEQYHGSFGLKYVPKAIAELRPAVGDTLWDYGTGTGKCVKAFREQGILANGVDITDARLLDEVRDGFVQCPLWDIDIPAATWGFCSDVMEHIPPEKVEDVLQGIYETARKGVFFTISTQADSCGRLIGETLHLTVQPAHWWRDLLAEYWDTVKVLEQNGSGVVIAVR